MSGFEIERKFIVKQGIDFRQRTNAHHHIIQGYIPANEATIRIRRCDDKAYLTIKSKTFNHFTRYEFEKDISLEEAENLFKLCRKPFIDKTRYIINIGNHTFEVDEFHKENEGLVIAEVELSSEEEKFDLPDFIDFEVTSDRRFSNKFLSTFPFSKWADKEKTEIKNPQNS